MIFTTDEGIAGNSAARTIFTHVLRRRNRGSLAIFFAEEIAHLSLGASKKSHDFWGSGKDRRRSRRESRDEVHSGRALELSKTPLIIIATVPLTALPLETKVLHTIF